MENRGRKLQKNIFSWDERRDPRGERLFIGMNGVLNEWLGLLRIPYENFTAS
jgi:hypothetical protein